MSVTRTRSVTRRFNYDDFRTGVRSTVLVEVDEGTTFLELCDLLVQVLVPIVGAGVDTGVLSIGTPGRGSLVVLDTARNVQVGRLLPHRLKKPPAKEGTVGGELSPKQGIPTHGQKP